MVTDIFIAYSRDQAWQDLVSRLRRVVERVEQQRAAESARAGALRRYQAAAATQLYDHRQWAEARKACDDALSLFQPGFSPDKTQVEQQRANCDQQLRTEAPPIRQAAPRQSHPEETIARPQTPALFSGARPLILGIIGGLALLFFVWIVMHAGDRKPNTQKEAAPTERFDKSGTQKQTTPSTKTPDKTSSRKQADPTQSALEKLEAQYYQKAVDAQTIPALQGFLKRYPAGKNAATAREILSKLQIIFRNHISDAYKLLRSGMTKDCYIQLDQALALDPANADVDKARALVGAGDLKSAGYILEKMGK